MTSLKIKAISLSIVCTLLACMSTGCNRSHALLDTIPADVAVVATLSPEQLDRDLDGTSFGGHQTSSETLDRYFRHAHPEIRASIKTMLSTSAIDRKLIAVYSHHDSNGADIISMLKESIYIITFKITDEKRLSEELEAGNPQEIDGFTVYRLKNSSLVVRDGQGWLISGKQQKAVAAIARQIEIAEGRSIASIKEASDFLYSGGHLFNMIVSLRNSATPGWTHLYGKLDDDGRELEFKAKYVDLNGKEIKLDDNLDKINTGLAKYIAPTDMFVMALGIASDTDWNEIINYVSSLFPMEISQRAMMGVAIPYLKRIDGTILIAAGQPSAGESATDTNDMRRMQPSVPGTSQVEFFIGIELKKDEIKGTFDELSNLIATLGIPATRLDDGRLMWSASGIAPVTMQVVNGNCIAVTNRQLEQLGNESAEKALKGNAFAIWANIPEQLARKQYGGPGFKLEVGIEDEFDASLRFNGRQMPILEQLAVMMTSDESSDTIGSDNIDF